MRPRPSGELRTVARRRRRPSSAAWNGQAAAHGPKPLGARLPQPPTVRIDQCHHDCDGYSDSDVWAGDPVNTPTGNLSVNDALNVNVATGRFGYGWTDSYNLGATIDSSSGAVTVRQEGSATVTFTPSGGAFTAPRCVTATLAAGPNGTYVFTLKNQKVDTFDSTGKLLSATDRNGYVTTLTYDSRTGRLSKVTDPAGRALKFSYGSNGLVSRVNDPQGRTVKYGYDASGNLISVTDVGKSVTTYTYDSQHRLLTVTDPKGGITTNVYDSVNRVVQQTDPMGRVMTWSYTAAITGTNGTTTVTDPTGNVTVRTFTNYQLTSITRSANAAGASTRQYAYDTA